MDIKNLCTFYVIRHGEATSNAYGIRAGHLDYPLSEKGVEDAVKRAKTLQYIHFDAAFSSDLARARQTTEIIALEHKLVVKTRRILRERHWGTFQGKSEAELRQLLYAFNTLSKEERFQRKVNPIMETSEEILDRFILFFRETAVAYPGKTVLVGTHGNIMRTFLEHLGFDQYYNIIIENTGYVVIQSDGIEFFIKEIHGISKRN